MKNDYLKRLIEQQAQNNVPEPPAGESECDVPMRLTVPQCIEFVQEGIRRGYAEGCNSVHAINDNKPYILQEEAVRMIMTGFVRLTGGKPQGAKKVCSECAGKGYKARWTADILCPKCKPKKKAKVARKLK